MTSGPASALSGQGSMLCCLPSSPAQHGAGHSHTGVAACHRVEQVWPRWRDHGAAQLGSCEERVTHSTPPPPSFSLIGPQGGKHSPGEAVFSQHAANGSPTFAALNGCRFSYTSPPLHLTSPVYKAAEEQFNVHPSLPPLLTPVNSACSCFYQALCNQC